MGTTWRDLILDQLDFYWSAQLWPRVQGLTDDEFLWKPADGAWSVCQDIDGSVYIEGVPFEPPVAPLTTIAWRIAHLGRDVLGKRARAFFGGSGAPDDAVMFDDRHWPEPLPLTAEGGLGLLQEAYTLWREGIASVDDEALLRPLGPKGGPFAEDSLAALAMHLSRETMAHGAEICLLRDLYRASVTDAAPIVGAAYSGDAVALRRLIGDGTSVPDLAAERPSLLADISALGHSEAVQILLEHGFPASNPTDSRTTALHYAAALGEHDAVDSLLAHGADHTLTESRFGYDPAGWAEHFGHRDIADDLNSRPSS